MSSSSMKRKKSTSSSSSSTIMTAEQALMQSFINYKKSHPLHKELKDMTEFIPDNVIAAVDNFNFRKYIHEKEEADLDFTDLLIDMTKLPKDNELWNSYIKAMTQCIQSFDEIVKTCKIASRGVRQEKKTKLTKNTQSLTSNSTSSQVKNKMMDTKKEIVQEDSLEDLPLLIKEHVYALSPISVAIGRKMMQCLMNFDNFVTPISIEQQTSSKKLQIEAAKLDHLNKHTIFFMSAFTLEQLKEVLLNNSEISDVFYRASIAILSELLYRFLIH